MPKAALNERPQWRIDVVFECHCIGANSDSVHSSTQKVEAEFRQIVAVLKKFQKNLLDISIILVMFVQESYTYKPTLHDGGKWIF